MKTFTLSLLMCLPALTGWAQDIRVTFAGTGTAIQIDSVTATNLSTNQSVTLPGNATLLLSPKTGVSDISINTADGIIFPNPCPGRTTLIASSHEAQMIKVVVRNLTGQVVTQVQSNINPGENAFSLSLPTEGLYVVSLVTGRGTSAIKVVCTAPSGSGNQVRYIGPESSNRPDTRHLIPETKKPDYRLKSIQFSYSLGYSAGETISYRCRSGEFTDVFTDSPMESKNYEVEFAPLARFIINPADSGTTETLFELDASGSADAETPADELEVRWDFDGDGSWDTEYDQGKTFLIKYPDSGKYTIILEVKDASALLGTQTREALVALASEGTFTDKRDYNRYPYKTIGTQVWMTKNLAWLPSVNEQQHESFTEKKFYVHGYDGTSVMEAKRMPNYAEYGVLYNGLAARDACPPGWHTASDEDWKTLEKFLGMSQVSADSLVPTGGRNSGKVGAQLKETGTTHWKSPNVGATNSSGFSARGGSIFWANTNTFLEIGWPGYFWTSTPEGEQKAYARGLYNWAEGIGRYCEYLVYGFSVRCIRD